MTGDDRTNMDGFISGITCTDSVISDSKDRYIEFTNGLQRKVEDKVSDEYSDGGHVEDVWFDMSGM